MFDSGHYIENVGDEPLKFLEVLKTSLFLYSSLTVMDDTEIWSQVFSKIFPSSNGWH